MVGERIWEIQLSLISEFWPVQARRLSASRLAKPSSEKETRRKNCLLLKGGKIEIRLGNRLLDTLPEFSIFGKMALIDHSPRSG